MSITITIGLMDILWFVVAYLVIGYVFLLGLALYEIYHNLSHTASEFKRGLLRNALWRSAVFSWAFPYAVIMIMKDKLEI